MTLFVTLNEFEVKLISAHSIKDRFFSVVHSPDDGTRNLTHANSASGTGGGPGSNGSGSTPPTPTKSQPN